MMMMSRGFQTKEGKCGLSLYLETILMTKRSEKNRMYVGFIYLRKACDKSNSELLWLILSEYDVSGKVLNGIKSRHINSLACKCKEEGQ